MLPFTKVFKFTISSFIVWNILLESRLDTLLSISVFFFLAFYMYEKTMIIFCGAGAAQKMPKGRCRRGQEDVIVEEALPVTDADKVGDDEGAA